MSPAPDREQVRLLALHDELIRGAVELEDAADVVQIGPLWLGRFGGHGLVTYRDLDGVRGPDLIDLIAAAKAHFGALGMGFEWKTRGHDDGASELDVALRAAGFDAEPAETVMVGEPAMLIGRASVLPDGVVLRQAGAGDKSLADDVAAVGRLHAAVFEHHRDDYDQAVLAKLQQRPDRVKLWMVVNDAGGVLCAGRLDLTAPVAGLWGGATDPAWRGRGLYRALTAARCLEAAQRGCTVVYAECTEFSRPILERSGLRAVTTTTPYVWSPTGRG